MDELGGSGLHVSISLARERNSECRKRTLRDFLQPMINWIAESAARKGGVKDSNK